MIECIEFYNTGDTALNNRILIYKNEFLQEIVNFVLDFLQDDEWDQDTLELFLPRQYIEDNEKKAKSSILDLRDIIQSKALRHELPSIQQYALFNIIQFYLDLKLDENGSSIINIPDDLASTIKNTMSSAEFPEEEIEDTIRSMTNIKRYQEDFFMNWDFLYIDEICAAHLDGIPIESMLGIDIEEYLDIISRDLRDRYQKEKASKRTEISDDIVVIQEINNAIIQLKSHALYHQSKTEVEISDLFDMMLKGILYQKAKISISRESPQGCAKIKIGAADLLLFRQECGYENIAIIENKKLNANFSEFLQLFGYLNETFSFGVTISISKNKTLDSAKQTVYYALQEIKDADSIKIKTINFSQKYNNLIISTHAIPERDQKLMPVYHFILNLSTEERQTVARIARRG